MELSTFSGPVIAALFTGLASSLHCLGMCGGAMAAIMLTARPRSSVNPRASNQPLSGFPISSLVKTLHAPLLDSANGLCASAAIKRSPVFKFAQNFSLVLAFNSGRILSYVLAGAAVGILGSGLGGWLLRDAMPLRLTLFIAANLIMLLAGFYIAGWTTGLLPLEWVGKKLWRQISPLTKRLMPVENALQAALLGALWGWIPCGLVYAMLIVALASGSAVNGALTMLAFGLGTLPAMTAAGLLSAQMKAALRNKRLRMMAGMVVMIIAIIGLNRAPALAGFAKYATLGELCQSVATELVKVTP